MLVQAPSPTTKRLSLVVARTCSAAKADGSPCRAAPLSEGEFCRMHDPELAETVAEGRRLGGQNRKRETVLAIVHDFEGLGTVPDIRRLLEIAVHDCLGPERGLNRARTLGYLTQQAMKLIEAGEQEERLAAIEDVLNLRPDPKTQQKGRYR